MNQLPLSAYAHEIQLESTYVPYSPTEASKEEIIDTLLTHLLEEFSNLQHVSIPSEYAEKRELLRGLMNLRKPAPVPVAFQREMDSLLQKELGEKVIVRSDQLNPISYLFPESSIEHADQLFVWQGDITQLQVDAIVNAANEYMLGCFQPLHACIDNAIHSAAGPLLREDCNRIMNIQNETEATGGAKITRAYHLPATYILHTVGPIVPQGTTLTRQQQEELASCYLSCLELAHEIDDIRTVALCSISTGVFGFPKAEASNIAVTTVQQWLDAHPDHHFKQIIFNVFSQEDHEQYMRVFQAQ
ncbi:Appr-1-p processing protein [Paenibacillus sp. Root52]|uniref:Protein-ADP-ribose hydrolase n=1 Tax=Paenibacillus amylolyticus TaxID=1451 RepID=A0AAP5H9A3_PAEAM|nr:MULTISPECIES: protein-ADP-ribose hydrolase [Paenibacillus]KQY94732.1 Appr-1-p processing protein [Paenibacillus sp. Root52]MDR6726286.1 O-acetyl-ADP-ribose deacetylase (regulator of RNase III) [Paenibacillus amylolyticus]